jgi:serine-type D-Ala-D-Ala carboxypeptidase/endopeptidase
MKPGYLFVVAMTTLLIGNNAGHAVASMNIENTADANMNIQNLLQEYLEDSETPGAAVALIDHGKMQFFYGGKMAQDGKPVTEDTLFEIGSITKVFTTLALMDMVDKEIMQLDDPIEMYLPGVKVPEMDGKKITLRHLATHTSGIPRMPDNFAPKDPANPYQDYTVESLHNYLKSCTLVKAPGDSFEYSNVGMGLLGHILSAHSGKNYEELIQSIIAKSLNMPNTSVSVSEGAEANFASGHHLQQAVSHWDLAPAFAGAGALRSNIKDMANFLGANMGVMASPLNGTLQKCHEKQQVVTPDTAFGLGWVLSKSNEADLIWHNGGTGGFRSYLGFNPKTQKGVVILSNSTGGDWDEFGSVILDPDYQRLIVDKTLANNPEYLNKFVGSYGIVFPDDLSTQQLQISVFGKLLASALSGGEVGMLYPESNGVFGVKGFPDGKVYFSFDDSGNISAVEARLTSNGTILWKATPILAQ